MEDYLKALYVLGENEVKTQALADRLEVSPASVTGMLKKLGDLNLVAYRRYRGASLTPAGRKIALETLRHHRLLETYLAEALGYAWHEVHDEAEKLEHHISEAFEERISEALGDPTHDPHGDPIPRLDGTVPDSPGLPLTEAEPGTRLRVTRIVERDREVLAYLDGEGVRPGSVVRIVRTAPFEGPLTVATDDGGERALAHALARRILAEPVGPEGG